MKSFVLVLTVALGACSFQAPQPAAVLINGNVERACFTVISAGNSSNDTLTPTNTLELPLPLGATFSAKATDSSVSPPTYGVRCDVR